MNIRKMQAAQTCSLQNPETARKSLPRATATPAAGLPAKRGGADGFESILPGDEVYRRVPAKVTVDSSGTATADAKARPRLGETQVEIRSERFLIRRPSGATTTGCRMSVEIDGRRVSIEYPMGTAATTIARRLERAIESKFGRSYQVSVVPEAAAGGCTRARLDISRVERLGGGPYPTYQPDPTPPSGPPRILSDYSVERLIAQQNGSV